MCWQVATPLPAVVNHEISRNVAGFTTRILLKGRGLFEYEHCRSELIRMDSNWMWHQYLFRYSNLVLINRLKFKSVFVGDKIQLVGRTCCCYLRLFVRLIIDR